MAALLGEFDKTALLPEQLRRAYATACRTRALNERITELGAKFSISDGGEEASNAAIAYAMYMATGGGKNAWIAPHYRSFTLCAMFTELLGRPVDWVLDTIRQLLSRATDPHSGGYQMVQHVGDFAAQILTAQSEVAPNLMKAAGQALAMKHNGISDGLVVAVVGDGSTATGEFTEALASARLFDLPLLVVITDNNIAISTKPKDGRTIKSFSHMARAYGLKFFSCNGRSFDGTYASALEASTYVRGEQRGAVLHVKNLPRLNGHSSAGDPSFDPTQYDPMLAWGRQLVRADVLGVHEIFTRRKERDPKQNKFFGWHNLGSILGGELDRVNAWIEQVKAEPEPNPAELTHHIYSPIAQHQEPKHLWQGTQTTIVPMSAAIRAALRDNFGDSLDDGLKFLFGQDVELGVFRATMALKELFPDKIRNAPINESLIMWLMIGYGMYVSNSGRRARGYPEIQFGDYAYHAMHCFRYAGLLNYIFRGKIRTRLIARMAVEPIVPDGGGANYHSMCMNELARIPGLVVVCPSTSYDAYGLLRSAAEYDGPVVNLECKGLYRQCFGPPLPGEEELDWARGAAPTVTEKVRVPLGKAAIRRRGEDVTVVCWGSAVHKALEVAEELSKPDPASGRDYSISVEVIDLRTLQPWDRETVIASARYTGRLIVAAEDNLFGGYQDTIVAEVAEACGRSVIVRRCGALYGMPAVPMHTGLEKLATLSTADIRQACEDLAPYNADGLKGPFYESDGKRQRRHGREAA